jgi:hypothetical protein
MPEVARFARAANAMPICDVYPVADFAALLRKRDASQDGPATARQISRWH